MFNRQLHPDERKWAKDNATKYQQYLASKTGEKITPEEAYQRLLSAGYAVDDNAATKAGKSDETAKQYINGEAPKNLFAASAAERASPFLNGNPDGSFTPEQQARFGTSKPGEQASTAVTKAVQYLGQPCTDCRNKAGAIDDAVVKLQEARVLYQDDPGSVKLIDQQIDQLKAGITKDELVRGMAGVISDNDKGIAALVLGTPSRAVAGATTSELLERAALTQGSKAGFETSNLQSKFEGYLLNPAHPQNQTKAIWFEKALGYDQSNWQQMASQITFYESKAIATKTSQYGQTFEQVLPINGANGKTIDVTFVFIKDNSGTVRLVTGIPTRK